jgi:serine/threonine protein kinase
LEARRLRSMSHQHVVGLLAVCFRSHPPFLVLEYMHNGDLKSFLQKFQFDSASDCVLTLCHQLSLATDVACGVAYLASIGAVHRDLAARNVLLSDQFQAKLGDFGP